MAEFDILNGKLDQILSIVQANDANTTSNTTSNSVVSSNSYISIVTDIKTMLGNAVGNGISSFVVNQTNINGQQKTVIEIRS